MLTYEIVDSKLNEVKQMDEEVICEDIEAAAAAFGLEMTQKTTLSTKKGSIHWHFTKPGEPGVIEVTWWPRKARLWIDIHNNRMRDWNQAVIGAMAERFTEVFGGEVEVSK